MKRVQYEESASWKKTKHGKSATRKKCKMKIAQHDQSIKTDQNLEKKCKRRVHYSSQKDNGLPLSRPL